MSYLIRKKSILTNYENLNERGRWDIEQYNWLIENFCVDCKENNLTDEQIVYEIYFILFLERGLYEYVIYDRHGNLDDFLGNLQKVYHQKYEEKLDVFNPNFVIHSPSCSPSINF